MIKMIPYMLPGGNITRMTRSLRDHMRLKGSFFNMSSYGIEITYFDK